MNDVKRKCIHRASSSHLRYKTHSNKLPLDHTIFFVLNQYISLGEDYQNHPHIEYFYWVSLQSRPIYIYLFFRMTITFFCLLEITCFNNKFYHIREYSSLFSLALMKDNRFKSMHLFNT